MVYSCNVCGRELPTLQGLRSHQSQCRQCADLLITSNDDLDSPAPTSDLQLDANFSDSSSDNPNYDQNGQPPRSSSPPIFDSDPWDDIRSEEGQFDDDDATHIDMEPQHGTADTTRSTSSAAPAENESTTIPTQSSNPSDSVLVEDFVGAGKVLGRGNNIFSSLWEMQCKADEPPWAPFPKLEDWELAEWIVSSGVSQEKVERYLKLDIVCYSKTFT